MTYYASIEGKNRVVAVIAAGYEDAYYKSIKLLYPGMEDELHIWTDKSQTGYDFTVKYWGFEDTTKKFRALERKVLNGHK